jgi:TonB family protein
VTPWRRGFLAFAIATLAPPASAAPGDDMPRVYVPVADYPTDVVPGEEQHVTVAFSTGTDGRASRCKPVRKSHDPRLDEAACRIVRERVRFAPEGGEQRLTFFWVAAKYLLTSRAKPGEPLLILRENWMTENDYPHAALDKSESGKVWYQVDVSATGLPQRCTIAESSGSKALDEKTCQLAMTRAIFIPASDGKGGTRAGRGTYSVEWRIS